MRPRQIAKSDGILGSWLEMIVDEEEDMLFAIVEVWDSSTAGANF